MEDREIVRQCLSNARRIVVKVGTNLLRGTEEGLNREFMASLARQISEIHLEGKDVILVSSGAVGAGCHVLGFNEPPKETHLRQALAAIGQSRLMHHYKQLFNACGLQVAQVLLTRDSLDHRTRYLNARNTFETLLNWRILPIVNENDTTAVEELRFGDNDQLSALIAGKIGADLLTILTDVEGIFDRPPSEPGAVRIPYLMPSQRSRVNVGEGRAGSFGLGGMKSKVDAARMATRAGILTFVGPGRGERVLHQVLEGADFGTWCIPQRRRISARKRWIALGKRIGEGRIYVDAGAEDALRNGGKSLLPSGVRRVEGDFETGELLRVLNASNNEIAIGLCRYSAAELNRVRGCKTAEVLELLGDRQFLEVIHRDDMVVMGDERANDDE
jgi:glutamate 5-kinase